MSRTHNPTLFFDVSPYKQSLYTDGFYILYKSNDSHFLEDVYAVVFSPLAVASKSMTRYFIIRIVSFNYISTNSSK